MGVDLTDDQWRELRGARGDRGADSVYDELIREVIGRVEAAGSIGKLDIGGILLWKRLRADTKWARALLSLPDAEIRLVTGRAVAAVRDQDASAPDAARAGRIVLGELPGLVSGDALASALLFAAAPDRMAVYDKRAHRAIDRLGIELSDAPGRYRRYMEIVDAIRDAVRERGDDCTSRDVDLALYHFGGGEPA
jgi:hypothetical protein